MRENIIIFGGLGFIGLKLAIKLCEFGFKVDIVDINFDKKLIRHLKNKYQDCFNYNNFNLTEKKLYKNLKKNNYKYIFDCAAWLGVDKVINNSYKSLKNNIDIAFNVSAFAKKQKSLKKIIFMSSSEVYDGGLLNNISRPPNKENSILTLSNIKHPRTVYMFSKIAGEMIYINSKLPYINLRLHNVFGPRMCETHAIPTFIKKFLSKKKYVDVYNKNHARSYIFIDEAIDQIIATSINSSLKNQTLNIGNDKNFFKNHKLVSLIKKVMNSNKKVIYKIDNKNSVPIRIPSLENLQNIYNFKNNENFIIQLKKTIEFYEKK